MDRKKEHIKDYQMLPPGKNIVFFDRLFQLPAHVWHVKHYSLRMGDLCGRKSTLSDAVTIWLQNWMPEYPPEV